MSDLSKVCGRLGDGAAPYVGGAQLGDLDGYWLEVSCCKGTTNIPLRMLAKQRGPETRLRDLLPLLHCKSCGGPPATAYLNETHNRQDCYGAPPGWSVQLIPAPVPAIAEVAE